MSTNVGAVILAAGSSSRMGQPKQALKVGDTSLLRRAVTAASGAGCSPLIVITGANAEASRSELAGLDVHEAWNSKWESGMGSSISAGINALLEADPQVAAVMIMLCDQPYVTDEVIYRLISEHQSTGKPVVASEYGGGFGVPALFHSSLFNELAGLDGASGAKPVIARHLSETHLVPFPGGEIDIDTPEDYQRLVNTIVG
ncbi:MAG TPA: nucleotidyltransferase family protein [Pyrinomonadaceae bacterium]|nr:nucleotidyltransferase family protein [Pyrinomonadaceae bacterium]